MIRLIWAMTKNRIIGLNNRIPWHIKEDLVYYKNKTKGKTVLMGENTYYSLKGYYKDRNLPYGKIFVASLNENLKLDDAEVINDIHTFLKNNKLDIWVVGGATIYKLCLPYADELYISFVKEDYKGDTYFPLFDFNDYKLIYENDTKLITYTIYERV